MAYVFLFAGIGFEVLGTTLLNYSEHFTRLGPSVASLVAYLISLFGLSKALESIDFGIVYATWGAVGMIASCIIGVKFFRQPLSNLGVLGLVLIIGGVIILNLYGHVD